METISIDADAVLVVHATFIAREFKFLDQLRV
jgi:hypothetical protein